MKDIVDLTLPVRPGMRGVATRPAYTLEKDGWNAANWDLYSHSGTHVDAPIHFGAHPITIEQMPLDWFCGEAHVAHIPDVQPRQILTPEDLGPEILETFKPGECLLLGTRWSQHVDSPNIYRDGLPRIGDALAQWCVDRQVKLIGVEPPSIADVNDLPEVTRIHKILLGAKITVVEGLTRLEQLGPKVYFQALPLNLSGGDGSPVRAIASPLPNH